ncbi:MAG: DUF1385 domain-containing protein [archaeon]
MKRKKETIGGRAFSNGILLMNNNYSVKDFYDNGDINTTVISLNNNNNKIISILKRVPIIRGLISIFLSIKFNVFKQKDNLLLVYFLIFNIFIILLNLLFPSLYNKIDNFVSNSLILSMLIFLSPCLIFSIIKNKYFFKDLIESLKYHGAEHKIVHYYENDFKNEIKYYPRLHKRCGSNLVFYYIFFSILFNVFFDTNFLTQLFLFGLAYEAILYTPKCLLFLPYFFQRLITIEPEEKHIQVANKALEALLEQN